MFMPLMFDEWDPLPVFEFMFIPDMDMPMPIDWFDAGGASGATT